MFDSATQGFYSVPTGMLASGGKRLAASRDHPGRLWSLLDIMNEFELHRFATLIEALEHFATTWGHMATTGHAGTHDPESYKICLMWLGQAIEFAADYNFEDCLNTIAMSESHLVLFMPDADLSTLAADVRVARDALTTVASNRAFLSVAKDRTTYIDNNDLFGANVDDAFPSARFDIREAGNCLAAECNTAAVFHLMRAVEWGLRALCVQLGFRRLRTINKRTGKVKYRLIEYTEWETILNQLQDRVDAKLTTVRRGPEKQLYQEFYYPALQDIRGIRDAWRNHVMHTRREYTSKEADAILDHVKRLMVTLASRVSEV